MWNSQTTDDSCQTICVFASNHDKYVLCIWQYCLVFVISEVYQTNFWPPTTNKVQTMTFNYKIGNRVECPGDSKRGGVEEGREREGERGKGDGRGWVRKGEGRGETPAWFTINLVSIGVLKVAVLIFFKYDTTLMYCLLDFWLKVALKALWFWPNKNT